MHCIFRQVVLPMLLKSGHSDILKMFHFTFILFICIVYNNWHTRIIKNRDLCVSFFCGITSLGSCDVTGSILKFETNT